MAEHTVRVCGFRYTDHNDIERVAHNGEVIDFSDEDAARGLEVGAFVTEETAVVGEATISPASTDDELEAFAKTAKVAELLEAAGGDVDFANRLLEAESGATGGEPRPTVVKGLAAVVGSAEGGGSTTAAAKEEKTEGVDYSKLKQPQLKALLDDRKVEYPKGVVKNATLIELLEADDKKSA